MNILITNDDGISSKGLISLVKAFSKIADVYVVAPEGERSSNSHHLTCFGQVKIEKRDVEYATDAYALWGTPADCVYLGVDFLFKDKIDMVVSGINKGLNVSTDIIYSGTIAAAREAYIHKLPALAVSLESDSIGSFDIAADYAVMIARKYYEDEKNTDYFLNLNVPDLKKEDIRGIKICDRVAVLHYDNNLSLFNENGSDYIRINDVTVTTDYDPDDMRVDYSAIKKGYVSLPPLYNDHFDRAYLKHIEKLI